MKLERVKCGHCGAEPSDADCEAALAQYHKIWGKNCAACNEPLRIISAQVKHRFYGESGSFFWETHWVIHEPYVALSFSAVRHGTGDSGTHGEGRLHEACFLKALPHARSR